MMNILSKIQIVSLLVALTLFLACSSDDDTRLAMDSFPAYGKPMQIGISMEGDNGGITRASSLATDKTVFITPDEGRGKWYAYNYDSETQLWKATKEFTSTDGGTKWTNTTTTQGMKWTAETMLIYAVVRNDNLPTADNAGPLTDVMTIAADQSTEALYNAQSILGVFDRFSYSTGRVTLHLQHILGRVVVNINNCTSPSTWSCTSWGKGKHGTAMGTNVNDSWAYYYRQGYLKIGDDQFTFNPVTTSLTNFKCWRYSENTSSKNVKFCCWMVPPSGVCICFCFKLTNGTQTYYTKNNSFGGISLLAGKTSTVNATLP